MSKYRKKMSGILIDDILASDNEVVKELQKLETELEKVKEDCREAINTTWRFIGAYKKENYVPIKGALKSAEYHLKQADYIFEEKK
jgi:hypothetical protein